VAQLASSRGPRPATAVVTVADLLSRNAPGPVEAEGSRSSTPMSVASLLRREGRAPHAVDPPVKPRAARTAEGASVARTPPVTGVTMNRKAIVAGTLLAAGSVFGAALLTDTSTVGDRAPSTGPYAGQGILDGTVAEQSGAPTVTISQAAAAGGLGAGVGAPTSWHAVAFPSELGGIPNAAAKPATTTVTPAVPTPSSGARVPSGAPVTGPGGSGVGPASTGPTGSNGVGGAVSAVTGAVGGAVSTVGSSVAGPVGGAAKGLGHTVSGTGKALGKTVDKVTEPVTTALEPVTKPVTSAVGGLLGGLLG
jgi:hypothetical protein